MTDIAAPWTDDQGAQRALRLLETHFPAAPNAAPASVWAAPGRVNLIGEHLDYNGGDVLPMALPHGTWLAIRPRADRRVRLVTTDPDTTTWQGALDHIAPGAAVPTWVKYALGSAWVLGQRHHLTGLDAALVSCLPLGAGLSSSAAVECVVALALDHLNELHLSRPDLATACVRAENEVVGAPTGGMDQAASLLCRAGSALALHCDDGTHDHVPLALADDGLELLVIDTRAPHRLVDGQYAQRRATCEAIARREHLDHLARATDPDGVLTRCTDDVERRRARHVLTEQHRVQQFVDLLRTGRLDGLGALMLGSHASLRDDYQVSCRELDLAVESACTAGALGARMTGGGFGGSIIALVEADDAEPIARAIASAFAAEELGEPAFFLALPEDGAGQDR